MRSSRPDAIVSHREERNRFPVNMGVAYESKGPGGIRTRTLAVKSRLLLLGLASGPLIAYR